jgi:hypothetical protein
MGKNIKLKEERVQRRLDIVKNIKFPTSCNLCGGEVEYIPNSEIYFGRSYGSGFAYRCTKCGAYVGTHKPHPTEAMGILADEELRDAKKKLHAKFDQYWTNSTERRNVYGKLAKILGIHPDLCHIGYFDKKQVAKADIALDIYSLQLEMASIDKQ